MEIDKTPDTIYLIPDSWEGAPGFVWCEDPAPTEEHNEEDAVKYRKVKSSSDPTLLSGLSPSEILELGWELRGCLLGSVHDGRDLARSLLGHPILSQYVSTIGADWTTNPMSAMVKVKMAIHKDLAR